MSKQEADSLKKISIYWLKQQKLLEKDCWLSRSIVWTHGFTGNKSSITIYTSLTSEGHYIQLIYTQTDSTGEKRGFDYKVQLTETPCRYGGSRFWFFCPLIVNGTYCGRRAATLYKAGDYFGCRSCFSLTYNSRNLSGISKVAGQVISIPELERLEKETKRKYYGGKMTRKYKMYLKKEEKSLFQLQTMAWGLSKKHHNAIDIHGGKLLY